LRSAVRAAMPGAMKDATALPQAQKVFTLVGVMLGMLLAALDQTIVATAGPTIQRELHIEPSLYTWITTAYLVASTVLVPIWGKLSDMFGRRRVLLAGIGIFLVGSVLCGVSQSAAQLIFFRAIQGIGSASLFTSALAVIADLFPPAERGKYQGFFGAVFGLSSVVGPLLGGFITDTLGWHWIFFINLPVGAVAVSFILARMPPLRPESVEGGRTAQIDFAGAFALALAVVPLLLALSLGRASVRPGETGYLWGSWQILALFAVALLGFFAFVLIEGRVRDPIVDLKLFTDRSFAVGTLASFVSATTFLGAIVFLPLFMVNVVGTSATSAGLTTVPLTFGIISGNILSGQLVAQTGKVKPFIVAASVCGALAYAVLGFTLDVETTRLEASWKMFLLGVGLGPAIPLYTLVVQNAVPPQVIGTATAVATFSRQMGATVGLAVLGTVFGTSLAASMKEHMAPLTAELPPAFVERLAGASTAPASDADEPGPKTAFDRARVEASLRAALASTPGAEEHAEERAAALAERIERAVKRSFAQAIAHIYVVSFGFALLSIFIAVMMPVTAMRRAAGRPPAPSE
jgi:EmrB/QacA subfamily drug resistance transporter